MPWLVAPTAAGPSRRAKANASSHLPRGGPLCHSGPSGLARARARGPAPVAAASAFWVAARSIAPPTATTRSAGAPMYSSTAAWPAEAAARPAGDRGASAGNVTGGAWRKCGERLRRTCLPAARCSAFAAAVGGRAALAGSAVGPSERGRAGCCDGGGRLSRQRVGETGAHFGTRPIALDGVWKFQEVRSHNPLGPNWNSGWGLESLGSLASGSSNVFTFPTCFCVRVRFRYIVYKRSRSDGQVYLQFSTSRLMAWH